jgi:hypothetical protein
MRCETALPWLVALQDDQVTTAWRAALLRHLDRCPSCRADERALRAATPRPGRAVPARWRARLDALTVASLLAVGAAHDTPGAQPPA